MTLPIHNGTFESFVGSSIRYFVPLNCFFSFLVSLRKWLVYFLFKKSNEEFHRNKHFSCQKNDNNFHISDQIKVYRLTFYIRHCRLWMEFHLELRLQSLYTELQGCVFIWFIDGLYVKYKNILYKKWYHQSSIHNKVIKLYIHMVWIMFSFNYIFRKGWVLIYLILGF